MKTSRTERLRSARGLVFHWAAPEGRWWATHDASQMFSYSSSYDKDFWRYATENEELELNAQRGGVA